MTVAAPFFLWVAGAVALATVAAHLLAWRRPPASPLPTARFAPERPARVVSRAVRPTDLALLAVRVATVMLAGLALARPTFARERRGDARVVVVDRSRSAGDAAAVSDSARAVFRPGDALVVFDSAAREVARAAIDSIGATEELARHSNARGSVSAALVSALRVAERLARQRDSVQVVIVSPLTVDQIDAATAAIRASWAGGLRVIRPMPALANTSGTARPDVRAHPGDPVAAALSLIGPITGGTMVRVRRDAVTGADSAFAQGGGSIILWPATPEVGAWAHRVSRDTAFAVVAGDASDVVGGGAATVVAPFARWVTPPAGRAVARWEDGEPAATEAALGSGCVRAVAIPVPTVGDLALTPAFRRFARRMVEPCGGAAVLALAPDSVVARVLPAIARVEDAPSPVNREPPSTDPSPVVAWLLGAALALAIGEMLLRRGESHATG